MAELGISNSTSLTMHASTSVVLYISALFGITAAEEGAVTIDPNWEDGANPTDPVNTVVLQSPVVTNWGRWGRWGHCSRTHSFVTGFQLKVESMEHGIDNTGVNAIELSCGVPEQQEVERISSLKGRWGTTRIRIFCSKGPATGFQLKVQRPQGPNVDDAATVNVRMICGNGQIYDGYEEQDEFVDSEWSEAIICPKDMAVCGIQTQVESIRFLGDDTTLNNIRIKCCPLPNDSNHQEEQELPSTEPGIIGYPPPSTTPDPQFNKPIPVYKLTIFKNQYGSGENETLNVVNGICNNLPLNWQKQVGSVISPDSCVRLWSDFDCQGQSRCFCSQNLLSLHEAYTNTPDLSWYQQVTSVGPCHVLGNDIVDKSATALLRDNSGQVTQLQLSPGECLTFYKGDKWRGQTVNGNIVRGCLRFYRAENCTGLNRLFSAPLTFEGEQWRDWTVSIRNCEKGRIG